MTATILLVDDDVEVLETLTMYLEALGYRTCSATNVEDGMKVLENEPVDLVISDVQMPGQSGLDFLVRIRKRSQALPVIIQTGRPMVMAAVECMRYGGNDYLGKPVDPAEMAVKIEKALVESRSTSAHYDLATNSIRRDRKGRILGRYRIVDTIGEGSFGVVFLATKEALDPDTKYALKVLKISALPDEERMQYTRRFMQEAAAGSRIRHPNVIAIHEFGIASEEDIPYLVMEYCDGTSLKTIIEENDSGYRNKVGILLEVAKALEAIHKEGIVHRDIKPDNVMIDTGNKIKITDFGIAKLPDSDLTVTTALLGTPNYMSPEGFKGANVDFRSDIFSFGIMAYELLVGTRPFYGDSLYELMTEICQVKPREPRKVKRDFPPALQAILAGTLKKDRDQRYAAASELAHDLQHYLARGDGHTAVSPNREVAAEDWA